MFALTDFEKRGALSMLDYMAKPEAALWMVTPLFRQMNVGLKAEGVASKPPETCPSCGGLRLPYHRVCPCGYDYEAQNPELVEKQSLFLRILKDPEVTKMIEEKLRTIIRKDNESTD